MDYRNKIVVEGTLKKSDLIRAFDRTLADLAPDAHAAIFRDADYMMIHQALLCGDAYEVDYGCMSAVADNLVEDLDVELGANAPDGYYFGTPDDNNTCFGFWEID